MDEKIVTALIAGAVSLIVVLIGIVANKRLNKAQSLAQDSNAAESMSKAAQNMIDTYNSQFIEPLKVRIQELTDGLAKSKLEVATARRETENIRSEMFVIRMEARRSTEALEFLVSATRDTHPEAVETALKIRKGDA